MTEEFEAALPRHEASLIIEHQPHKAVYETVEGWIEEPFSYSWPSEAEKQKAIDTNQVWTLQWYPDTPVGFYCVAAASLEAALKHARAIEESE